MSDALGIHASKESENKYTDLQIWAVTLTTFAVKLLAALSFIIPLVIFPLGQAVIVSIVWGLLLLGLLNYFIAKEMRRNPIVVIAEHTAIAVLVIFASNLVGNYIASIFH